MKTPSSLITVILPLLPFSGSSAASLPGCHPTWQRDTSYLPSSLVSLSTLVNATLRTYKTFNYQCKEDPLNRFCGQVGFQPGLDGIDGAWTLVWQNVGECEGNVALSPPTAAPTRSRWSGVGCPDPFKMDVSYAEGDRVQVNGEVYQCKPFPYSGYCGQSGFEPGTGTAWNDAWTLLGSCQGTISPTSSPNYDLPVFGGCPEEYSESAVYEDGDKVSLNGLVFKCRAFPYSVWCSHDSYAPSTENWKDAWEVLGTCQGSMSPTASPVFDVLVDVDGCPEKYVEGKGYEAGDRVTLFVEDGRGIVYRCADQWPESGYCGLIPPGHASKLGWTLQGSCSGTIAPSSSPFFVSLPDTSGCPEKYSASKQYESGDRVSVYVDSERAVVWECKQYPNGPYCNQYPPNDDSLLGWSKVGSCTGTMSPTSSPIFVNLAEVGDGCPKTFDVATRYETGDLATVDSSNIPSRKLVYECKSPYCNAGPDFAPGSANSDLGWVLKGYCGGTIAPTSSPVAWSGTCQYNNGTARLDVHPWSLEDLSSYKAGTRVRKGSRMFQCKVYPYYLWCRMSAYEPGVGASWRDAWINAGTCQ